MLFRLLRSKPDITSQQERNGDNPSTRNRGMDQFPSGEYYRDGYSAQDDAEPCADHGSVYLAHQEPPGA
jgi:hypothetical protein